MHRLRLALRVNRRFFADFLAAAPPSFALGHVAEGRTCRGFMALHLERPMPPAVADAGFQFGHSLLALGGATLVHFTFAFPGFATYTALVNPASALVQRVLTTMADGGDYFFLMLDGNGLASAFRSELQQEDLAGLRTNLPPMRVANTTEAAYRRAVDFIATNLLAPHDRLLDWVNRQSLEHLDPDADPMDLRPR